MKIIAPKNYFIITVVVFSTYLTFFVMLHSNSYDSLVNTYISIVISIKNFSPLLHAILLLATYFGPALALLSYGIYLFRKGSNQKLLVALGIIVNIVFSWLMFLFLTTAILVPDESGPESVPEAAHRFYEEKYENF